ncbi:hypothetical protein Trydic_g5478 [Trypoxylus dichotomus]
MISRKNSVISVCEYVSEYWFLPKKFAKEEPSGDSGVMVNTRRMESSGSGPYSGLRYRTRGSNERTTEVGSFSDSVSETEESQAEEDSWSSQEKRKKHLINKPTSGLPSRVRELRSRFVCNELKFKPRHLRNSAPKSSCKRVSLPERHSLTVYTHKMRKGLNTYNPNESDDDYYSPSFRGRRHLRHRSSVMARVERRTALSLRPLIAKSYVDRSPMTCNSDDSDAVGVRRSTRQRNFQFKEMSWITDQMPKKGYPNVEYSEEDSRDVQTSCNTTARRLPETTRRDVRDEINGISTRREIKKNTKYLHDYETAEVNAGRRRSRNEEVRPKTKKSLRSHRDIYSSNNKDKVSVIATRVNGRLSKSSTSKQEDDEEEQEEENDNELEGDEEDAVEGEVEDAEDEEQPPDNVESEKQNNQGNKKDAAKLKIEVKGRTKDQSSESDTHAVNTRKATAILDDTFSPRRTRGSTQKIIDTSSSSEEERVYSLRERVPKQSATALIERAAIPSRNEKLRSRRRYRRKRSPTSSDTSDSEDRCRNKYSKTSKTPHSKNEQQLLKSGAGGSKVIPIGPETLDSKIRFSSVGGLDSHIQCLKEMVLLPMMYPEVFDQFQIQPPRGVLFHGPPGTGKTLIARALANECCFGSRKISFFMRKGADLLSKWIGESEKQLRLLFEQAGEMKPSIIFFDELDGLAPVRSSRQDQIHASIVSTLLALMDGLDNRGEVIVIGATNRIDAIDPALRRPGRFDRELYFPLPSKKEREEILCVHVSQWSSPPSNQLLNYLAENAVGYCGSDLRALCSEAVIHSFRRTYPQVYNADYKLELDPKDVKVEKIDFLRAKSQLIPSSHRTGQRLGRKLLLTLKPLLENALRDVLSILDKTFPHGVNPHLAKVRLSSSIKPAQLLLVGDSSDHGQTTHLAPAILYDMEHIHAHILDLTTLYSNSSVSPEEACVQVFHEVRRNVPSVLYIPSIDQWWSLISDTVKMIFLSQLSQLDPNSPILLLATANAVYSNLPPQIQGVFSQYRNETYELNTPTEEERYNFFKPLLIDSCLKLPRSQRFRPKTPPMLPRAPTPVPEPLSEEQKQKIFETEEHTLRELRIFLREICKKLANNRLFYMFTKPVDTEEVPDYPTIIKQPMDLETMMTKVDFHQYECAKDFLNDIELIVQNALEYNPAKTSADKQIRHRACSLRDYAFTLIKNEMDSDFEDKCQDISKKRRERKASVTQYLPPFLQTMEYTGIDAKKDLLTEIDDSNSKEAVETVQSSSNGTGTSNRASPCRKRKVSSWQRGFLNNKKKRRKETLNTTLPNQNEEKMSEEEINADDPHVTPSTSEGVTRLHSSEDSQEMINGKSIGTTTSLTVNCDTTSISRPDLASPLQSPNNKRRLSDILSPSELLENSLDFDDVDQALKEIVVGEPEKLSINVDQKKLNDVLQTAISISNKQPLQSLLDLQFQLNRIINKYSRTYERRNLPTELHQELERYSNKIKNKMLS